MSMWDDDPCCDGYEDDTEIDCERCGTCCPLCHVIDTSNPHEG